MASEAGTTVYLNVYCVDYACKCYYMAGPTVLDIGIKDGKPYYNEEELALSEEEFKKLYARLYNL